MGEVPFFESVQRTFEDLRYRQRKLTELDFFALVKKAVGPGYAEDIILLADRGDGSSNILNKSEKYIGINSAANIAKFQLEERSTSKLPYTIQSMFGATLSKFSEMLRIKWDSLLFREKFSFLLCWILFLFLGNALLILVTTFQHGQWNGIYWYTFIQFKEFIVFVLSTMISLIYPSVVVMTWKRNYFGITTRDIIVENEIVDLLRRNNFKAMRRKFERSFEKKIAPLLILIDSFDDLNEDFDIPFLLDLIKLYREARVKVTIVGISKSPSETRMKFYEFLQGARILKLNNLTVEQQKVIGISQPIQYLTIKEIKTILKLNDTANIHNQEIQEYRSRYDNDSWSAWSVISILSVSEYVNEIKFNNKILVHWLEQRLDLLNNVGTEMGLKQILNLEELRRVIDDFFNSEIIKYLQPEDQGNTFTIDSSFQKQIYRETSISWKMVGLLLWLDIIKSRYIEIPDANMNIWVKELVNNIIYELQLTSVTLLPRNEIGIISKQLLEIVKREGCGTLCKSLGILYFISYNSLKYELEEEELAVGQSMLLYGSFGKKDYDLLCRLQKKFATKCTFVHLLSTIYDSSDSWNTTGMIDLIGFYNQNKSEFRGFLGWLIYEGHKRHWILPYMILRDFNRNNFEDSFILPIPENAGGLNFATLWAMSVLSDAIYANNKEMTSHVLTILSKGVLFLVQKNNRIITRWESIWMRIVFCSVLTELICYIAQKQEMRELDIEGYRHDLKIPILTPEFLDIMNELCAHFKIGLTFDHNRTIPVIVIKQLVTFIDLLILELLLLDLNETASIIMLYRIKLIGSTRNIESLSKYEKDEYYCDLRQNILAEPALVRSTIVLESLIIKCKNDSRVHLDVAVESIERILSTLEEFNCDSNLYYPILDEFITRLKFANISQAAIKLKLKKHKRIKKVGDNLSVLDKSIFYIILADDLYKIGKKLASKSALYLGNKYLEMYDGELNIEYFEVEMFLFTIKVEIREEFGDEEKEKLLTWLKDEERMMSACNGVFAIILLSIKKIGRCYIKDIYKAALSTANRLDEYAGYQRCWMLASLMNHMEVDEKYISNDVIDLAYILFKQLSLSKQNMVVFEATRKSILLLLRYSNNHTDPELRNDIELYLRILYKQELEKIYLMTLSIWIFSGEYGKIVEAYYRVLRTFLYDELPNEVRAWLSMEGEDKKNIGINLLNKYKHGEVSSLWLVVPIIKDLNYLVSTTKDKELEMILKESWSQIDIECTKSLLGIAYTSRRIPSEIRAELIGKRIFD